MTDHWKLMTFWNVLWPGTVILPFMLVRRKGGKAWDMTHVSALLSPPHIISAVSTADTGSSRVDSTWMDRSSHTRCLSPSWAPRHPPTPTTSSSSVTTAGGWCPWLGTGQGAPGSTGVSADPSKEARPRTMCPQRHPGEGSPILAAQGPHTAKLLPATSGAETCCLHGRDTQLSHRWAESPRGKVRSECREGQRSQPPSPWGPAGWLHVLIFSGVVSGGPCFSIAVPLPLCSQE